MQYFIGWLVLALVSKDENDSPSLEVLMRLIRSIVSFLNRYRLTCVLVTLLVLFSFNPLVSAVTHIPAQSYGSIVLSFGHDRDQQATKQASLCFSQAHHHCHPAPIDVQFIGADTDSFKTLSTANALGWCTLTLSGHATGPCGSPLCLLKGFSLSMKGPVVAFAYSQPNSICRTAILPV